MKREKAEKSCRPDSGHMGWDLLGGKCQGLCDVIEAPCALAQHRVPWAANRPGAESAGAQTVASTGTDPQGKASPGQCSAKEAQTMRFAKGRAKHQRDPAVFSQHFYVPC